MSGPYGATLCQTIEIRTYLPDRKPGLVRGFNGLARLWLENGRLLDRISLSYPQGSRTGLTHQPYLSLRSDYGQPCGLVFHRAKQAPGAAMSPKSKPSIGSQTFMREPWCDAQGRGRLPDGFGPVIRRPGRGLAAIPAGESPANRGVQSL